jgi:phosphoglycerol transferase MdoB-like AlkP superfamily enzyme
MVKLKISSRGGLHIHTILGFILIALILLLVITFSPDELISRDFVLSLPPWFLITFVACFVLWFIFKLTHSWRKKQEMDEG